METKNLASINKSANALGGTAMDSSQCEVGPQIPN